MARSLRNGDFDLVLAIQSRVVTDAFLLLLDDLRERLARWLADD